MTRIPNFDTLSTLIDRLSIENVKLAHFENAVEHDPLSAEERAATERRIAVQREIIGELKTKLATAFEETFLEGKYEYFKEERTFR